MEPIEIDKGIECRLEEYLQWLRTRGRKEATVRGVRFAVRKCAGWLGSQGIRQIGDVKPEDAAVMAHSMKGKESSRRMWTSHFAGYVRWATGIDVIAQAGILWNPPGEASRKWLSREDYLRMMEKAGPRERLILALGATMGLRRSEMCALTLDDLRDGCILIHGKGHGEEGKVAEKRMSAAVARELEAYLAVRKPSEDRHILIGRTGRGLGSDQVYRTVRRLGESVGAGVNPHALRRLYAMTLADEGVPLETIARMMRHESPVTTMRCYLKADPRRMADAQAKVDAVLAR